MTISAGTSQFCTKVWAAQAGAIRIIEAYGNLKTTAG